MGRAKCPHCGEYVGFTLRPQKPARSYWSSAIVLEEAIEMRKKGNSYSQIGDRFGLTASAVKYYFHKYVKGISDDQFPKEFIGKRADNGFKKQSPGPAERRPDQSVGVERSGEEPLPRNSGQEIGGLPVERGVSS